jgi:Mg-chelatase subunit ChlD
VFHDTAREELKDLRENPDYGGTEIEGGFKLCNDLLREEVKKFGRHHFTIIFISDGADNSSHTIKERMENLRKQIVTAEGLRINFICVGVGSGFPTFLAMQARSMYHNGDASVPPVFLIEQTCS